MAVIKYTYAYWFRTFGSKLILSASFTDIFRCSANSFVAKRKYYLFTTVVNCHVALTQAPICQTHIHCVCSQGILRESLDDMHTVLGGWVELIMSGHVSFDSSLPTSDKTSLSHLLPLFTFQHEPHIPTTLME